LHYKCLDNEPRYRESFREADERVTVDAGSFGGVRYDAELGKLL
jgi:hypothetical protein